MHSAKRFLALICAALLVLGQPALWCTPADARSTGGFRSSSSFSRSGGAGYGKGAQWSTPTRGTWDRNGGGLFGSGKSTTSGENNPSSSGYSKPRLQDQPGPNSATPAPAVSPSSSGYTKPLPGGQPKPSDQKTSGGYAKPSAATTQKDQFTGGSKFDKETIQQVRKQRAKESLESYKAEQSKFGKPDFTVPGAESSPLAQKARVPVGFDYGSHYRTRDDFFRSQGYQPPSYAYGTSAGFGVFSGLFLYWMLDHLTDKNVAAAAYHYSDDPGFKKWHQEVENQAKDNAELKAKLAEMDKQVNERKGTPTDPAYLPPGVPPGVALSESVLAAKKPEKPILRFATGPSGGWYAKCADMLKKTDSSLEFKAVPTGGSLDNLRLLVKGDADLAIVQSDVLALIEKKLPGKSLISEQSTLYVEVAQLIANRDSRVKSVEDIDPRKDFIFVGPKGSGTALTWEGLCEQAEHFRNIPVKHADYQAALAEVARNPKALMLFVGGLKSEILDKAETMTRKSGNLRLVALDDKHFIGKLDNHGNTIYKFVKVPKDIYPALQKGWFFSGDVESLGLQAVLVLRSDWAEKNGPQAMDALSLAILETKPEIQRLINGPK